MHSLNPDVPRLRDHADAARYYANQPEYRNPKQWLEKARPLGKNDLARRKKQLVIHPTSNGDYACRYHSTDVVTYHEDGALSLDPYASVSTNHLVNALVPQEMWVDYRDGRYNPSECVVWCQTNASLGPNRWWDRNQLGYRISDETRFARNAEGWFEPVGETESISVEQLDLKAAAEVRKQYPLLAEFCNWIVAAVHMGAMLKPDGNHIRIHQGVGDYALERINDRSKWRELLNAVHYLGEPSEGWGRSHWKNNLHWSSKLMITKLRREIYQDTHCVQTVKLPYYEGRADYARVKKLNKIWE